MRRRIDLDGLWDFLHAGTSSFQPVKVRDALVPGPWQAQFSDLRMRAGIGIYRRMFVLPAGWRDGSVVLCFGAVFHTTRVWVNGVPVGTNEGGFLPFEFDITEAVVEGENEIKVRVESPTDNTLAYPDTPLAEIPFGKQSWYGPLSGIWQSVFVECRSVDPINAVRIRPDPASSSVAVRVLWAAPVRSPAELVCEVSDPAGRLVASAMTEIDERTEEVSLTLTVPDMQLWSLDEPNLYRLSVVVSRRGTPSDEVEKAFGFRTFETRDGRFYLNGSPVYLRGALDQDYYPDGICTVPSAAFLDDQLLKSKQLGLNCIRIHIKAADPRYLAAADRMGILVWAELPNGGVSTERSRARKERLLKGMVDRDGHHPSIVIWTIINENWGVDLVHDASHRAWLEERYRWLKSYDPTRLVVDNSPIAPSFHIVTDIVDYHFYSAIPDHRSAWDDFVDQLANRESFLFSPHGDAKTTGAEPVICSEFGNWGLPKPNELAGPDGREPWWFETGHDWGGGVMYPHGIEHRFADWHLDRVFGTLEDFVVATQWQQFRALEYQIGRMRARSQIAGYVITELTDVHWEANGLLDMRRNTRAFHDVFHWINGDTMIATQVDRTAYWTGERLSLRVRIAHGAGRTLENERLTVGFAIAGQSDIVLELPPLVAGTVTDLGTVDIAIPDVTAPRIVRLELMIGGRDAPLARNWLDVALHPCREKPSTRHTVWSPDGDIASRLRDLGYTIARDISRASLVVVRENNPDLASHVRDGGRLLLIADAPMPLYPLFPHWQNVKIEARNGTPWQGDWASSFAWLMRAGPFAALPGAPLLDMAFDRVIPDHVVSGVNLHDFHGRVHAGLVVGWIHKPVALAVERGYGRGHFVATTFRLLRDPAGADPTATVLLDALVERALHGRELAIEDDADATITIDMPPSLEAEANL